MKSEIEVFREFIKKRKMRNTPEREAIIREIFATHDHFDVDELYSRLKKKHIRVSRVSVYRIIPLLIEAGLIQEAHFEDGHLHYEHIFGHNHHCHLRCLNCGNIVEFEEKALYRLEEKLTETFGYAVKGHKLEVFGYCPKCRTHIHGRMPK